MTLVDFLKKIMGKSTVNESKIKAEELAFDEIGDWVENKGKEIKDKEKEVLVLIKDRVALLIKDLKEKVKVLESIDIESKKVEDGVKLIVRGNLNNYVYYVKNLIENIDNLNEEELEKFIPWINEIFSDFEKKSYVSYQKTTFLIGKEIGDIKKSIVNFSKYLIKKLNNNKDIIDSSKIISFIKVKLNQIGEADEIIHRIDEGIKLLNGKIKNIKEIEKKNLEKIEKIKKSKSYAENLKKQEEIKLDEKRLEKEIHELKDKVNFKALGNVFHAYEKEMNIIKDHKKNFQAAFQKDGGASILSLLDEAKLNNEAIISKIKKINDKKEEITKNKSIIKKCETKDLLAEIKEVKLEINNLNNEKAKELKRCERVKINKENIIISIKQNMAKINMVL